MALVFSPVFRLIGSVRIHMRRSVGIRRTGAIAFGLRLIPVSSLALSVSLAYALGIGFAPGFRCTLCDSLRIGLSYGTSYAMSLGHRHTVRLANRIGNTLVPSGAFCLAYALAVTLRSALCDTLRYRVTCALRDSN